MSTDGLGVGRSSPASADHEHSHDHSDVNVAGLLVDDDRRRVFAAVVLGASTVEDVVVRAGLDHRAATVALQRLVAAGLIGGRDRFEVQVDALRAGARSSRRVDPGVDLGTDPQRAAVLRSYFRDGRLEQIPTQHSKRLVVLDVLAQRFAPGQLYSEAHVNLELGKFHRDTAALRRHLVDAALLERRDGMYWRSGGTFEV